MKKLSLALKAVVILSAAVGTLLSALAARSTFMGGSAIWPLRKE